MGHLLRISLLFSVGLFCYACSQHPHYTIDGRLPSTRFDGEQVYLVPFTGATAQTVDSCTISGGKFRFAGTVDSVSVYIVRTRPQLRLTLQDALVIKEAGTISVRLDSGSTVSGTLSNNRLQKWKQQKAQLDSQLYLLVQQYAPADSMNRLRIRAKSDSLKQITAAYHEQFADENKNNAAGKFVARLLQSH